MKHAEILDMSSEYLKIIKTSYDIKKNYSLIPPYKTFIILTKKQIVFMLIINKHIFILNTITP